MIPKKYTIEFIVEEKKLFFFKNKKKILIKYGGATLLDNMKLMECKNDEERVIFFFNWIKSKCITPLTSSDEKYLLSNLETLVQTILDTAFKVERKGITTSKTSSESPYSSYVVFLAKELGIEPRKLLQYTLQEIEYLSEGLTRNLNARTEEGERENRAYIQKLNADKLVATRKKEIDEFLKSD